MSRATADCNTVAAATYLARHDYTFCTSIERQSILQFWVMNLLHFHFPFSYRQNDFDDSSFLFWLCADFLFIRNNVPSSQFSGFWTFGAFGQRERLASTPGCCDQYTGVQVYKYWCIVPSFITQMLHQFQCWLVALLYVISCV